MNFFVALAVALLVAGPASAMPAGAAVALFGAGGVGAFASSIVGRLLIGTALSALGSAMQRRGTAQKNPGLRTDVTTQGETLPQTFLLGKYATAGNFMSPHYAHGSVGKIDNAFRTQIIDLSDLPLDGLSEVWINGQKIAYPGEFVDEGHEFGLRPDPAKFPDLYGAVWIKYHGGYHTTADGFLTSTFGGHPERPWSADMIGTSMAYAVMTFEYDPEVFQGEPQVRFAARGLRLYDPRKDSTNGGSGAHRWNNDATWEYTGNPAVMIYNLLRGIPLPDGASYGLGVGAADLPSSVWFAAMNKCAEQVNGKPRYIAGYEVRMATAEDGGDAPLDVVDELLKACDGEIVDMGGQWLMRAGPPGLPLASITDEDILRNRPQDLDPFRGMAETFNAVRASYPSPEMGWQSREAPPRYDAAAEAEDGQRLVADIQLPAVTDGEQVQRLMTAWLRDTRRQRRHTITLPPEFSYLTPLDTIEWNSTRNGYVTKIFEIAELVLDPLTLAVTLSIRERNPADYDWTPDDLLPTTAPSQVKRSFAPSPLPGFQVQAVSILDGDGVARRAAIEMSWPSSLAGGIQAVAWQIRRTSSGAIVSNASTADVGGGEAIVSEGLLPGTSYEVRARGLRQTTDWTGWYGVTTLPAEYLTGDEANSLRDAAEKARNVARESADLAREVLRSKLEEYDARREIGAQIAEERFVRSTESFAIASDIKTLTATVGDNTAELESNAAVLADIDGTLTAAYLWRARAGGGVGEIELVAGGDINGGSSLFSVKADRFQFLGEWTEFFSNVTISGDLMVNGTITGSKVVDLTLDTAKVANNAITRRTSSYTSGSKAVDLGTFTQIASITISTNGGDVLLNGSFTMNGALANNLFFDFRVLRGGSVIYTSGGSVASSSGKDDMFSFSFMDSGAGTGSNTYAMEIDAQGSTNFVAKNRFLGALEVKK
jgi:hypothetical protein